MKTIMLGAAGFALLVVSAASHAQWDDDTEYTGYSHYQGKKYASSMPAETLTASPDFDIANATLPKSIKDITEVARTQLEKVTGPKSGWKLSDINLHRSNRNEKKWFYAVNFSPPSMAGDNISIIATVDGRLGVLKEISERKIE